MKRGWFLLMVLLVVGAVCHGSEENDSAPLMLFSEEEAGDLRLDDEEWTGFVPLRLRSSGPRIVVQDPQVQDSEGVFTIETGSPTSLVVVFMENASPVDMDSLEVQVRKGIFKKSLTLMLKPYIDSTTLEADAVEIPPGKFRVEIKISDVDGATTIATYRLRVDKE